MTWQKNPDLANWSGKGLMKKTGDGRVMQNELNSRFSCVNDVVYMSDEICG